MISQASSEYSICCAIESKFASLAKRQIEKEFELEIIQHQIEPVQLELNVAIIAIVGENIRQHSGVAGRIFSALGSERINIMAIAQGSSELNISLVVKQQESTKAVQAIHKAFYFSSESPLLGQVEGKRYILPVFLVGIGLIGKTLIRILTSQIERLQNHYQVYVKLIGVANSKLMLINSNGIDLHNIHSEFTERGVPCHLENFVSNILRLKLPNSVFVDCTASETIVQQYTRLLDASVHIVAANKKPFTSIPFPFYVALKQIARTNQISLLYETTVGAGLPTISTLKNLVRTGDKVIQIEAVLSGTLSYVFNSFDGKQPFSQIVFEARTKGFTEPDPRDDLNGLDVGRKILILVRELGLNLELDDIEVENLVPEQFRSLSLQEFLEQFSEVDSYFEEKRIQSFQEGKVLRYIASYHNGKCSVSLQSVGPDHPSYQLSGSDNIIIYRTEFYSTNPLVIKGPGAGPEVTAQGVFADILSLLIK